MLFSDGFCWPGAGLPVSANSHRHPALGSGSGSGGDQRRLRPEAAVTGGRRGGVERRGVAVQEQVAARDQFAVVPGRIGSPRRLADRRSQHVGEPAGRHAEPGEQHVGPAPRLGSRHRGHAQTGLRRGDVAGSGGELDPGAPRLKPARCGDLVEVRRQHRRNELEDSRVDALLPVEVEDAIQGLHCERLGGAEAEGLVPVPAGGIVAHGEGDTAADAGGRDPEIGVRGPGACDS